ncbi:uncharacterized protein [Oscarella lobularis]|uniref:uncharacterized protein n=1 Tax=Oscarella lobularis TaxID=121494 RepID=UPI0033144D1D
MHSSRYLALVFVVYWIGASAQDTSASTEAHSQNSVKCWNMTKRRSFLGCPSHQRSKKPFYDESLNDVTVVINSSKVLGSVYPNNVKCVWTFHLRQGERATIACPQLNLDTYNGDCGTGSCSRTVVYTKHRDFLQIVGETARQKKNHCCEKCRECKKKFTSCGKEKKNFVAFCGARADNFSKPRADISYSETIDGKIKVIFWSDESKQGNGFLCRFINKDRLLERSSVSVAGRARSLVRATPHPCVLKKQDRAIEEWLSSTDESNLVLVDSSHDCTAPATQTIPANCSENCHRDGGGTTEASATKPGSGDGLATVAVAMPAVSHNCERYLHKCKERGRGCGRRCKSCCDSIMKLKELRVAARSN